MVAEEFQPSDGLQGLNRKRLKINKPTNAPRGSSPLGLILTKTPSFLELIETKLSQQRTDLEPKIKERKARTTTEKLKASNFPALSLQIGSWKRVASYNGDIVAKFYFAKKKLVWEVLYEGLKSKMEIQWLHISAIRATFVEGQPSTLEIELDQQPTYSCETNPRPKKHTIWQNSDDFTGGEAQIYRRHFLTFQEGTLQKHYEKLLHCDAELYELSQRPFPTLNSPFFDMVPNEKHALSVDLRSKHPYLFYQPPKNMFPPQQLPPQQLPLQNPLVGNPGTINTPTQHIMPCQPIAPSISSIDSLQLQTPVTRDMGMSLANPAMNVPCIDEFVSIPIATDPMPLQSGNNFQTIDAIAAMISGLDENMSLWNQRVQNMKHFFGAMENQSQELPIGACATPAPNIHTRRVGLERTINSIDQYLLSKPKTPIYTNDQTPLFTVSTIGSAINEVAQVAPTSEGFNQRNDAEYNLGDSNSLMAPRVYKQTKAQVAPPPEEFYLRDGGYNLSDPNILISQTEKQVAPQPESFNLMNDRRYNLCDPNSSMRPRDYNQTEGQGTLLPEGFILINDGGHYLGVLDPSVGMQRDQETDTKVDGNSELLHPFLH